MEGFCAIGSWLAWSLDSSVCFTDIGAAEVVYEFCYNLWSAFSKIIHDILNQMF